MTQKQTSDHIRRPAGGSWAWSRQQIQQWRRRRQHLKPQPSGQDWLAELRRIACANKAVDDV